MTYGEFKNLGFPDFMPMENALEVALCNGQIDVSEVLLAYTRALQAEKHRLSSQFEEACICINMHLSKHWNSKENRKKLNDRMIHIYNKTKTLPPHIYDNEYSYTEEDEKKEEENYQMHYFGLPGGNIHGLGL